MSKPKTSEKEFNYPKDMYWNNSWKQKFYIKDRVKKKWHPHILDEYLSSNTQTHNRIGVICRFDWK